MYETLNPNLAALKDSTVLSRRNPIGPLHTLLLWCGLLQSTPTQATTECGFLLSPLTPPGAAAVAAAASTPPNPAALQDSKSFPLELLLGLPLLPRLLRRLPRPLPPVEFGRERGRWGEGEGERGGRAPQLPPVLEVKRLEALRMTRSES